MSTRRRQKTIWIQAASPLAKLVLAVVAESCNAGISATTDAAVFDISVPGDAVAETSIGCTRDELCNDNEACNGVEYCELSRGVCGRAPPIYRPTYRDVDGDGFGDPQTEMQDCHVAVGYTSVGRDCDDASATSNPQATELCDELDNNCNGVIDEGRVCEPMLVRHVVVDEPRILAATMDDAGNVYAMIARESVVYSDMVVYSSRRLISWAPDGTQRWVFASFGTDQNPHVRYPGVHRLAVAGNRLTLAFELYATVTGQGPVGAVQHVDVGLGDLSANLPQWRGVARTVATNIAVVDFDSSSGAPFSQRALLSQAASFQGDVGLGGLTASASSAQIAWTSPGRSCGSRLETTVQGTTSDPVLAIRPVSGSCGENTVRALAMTEGALLASLAGRNDVTQVAFIPENNTLARLPPGLSLWSLTSTTPWARSIYCSQAIENGATTRAGDRIIVAGSGVCGNDGLQIDPGHPTQESLFVNAYDATTGRAVWSTQNELPRVTSVGANARSIVFVGATLQASDGRRLIGNRSITSRGLRDGVVVGLHPSGRIRSITQIGGNSDDDISVVVVGNRLLAFGTFTGETTLADMQITAAGARSLFAMFTIP